MGIGCTLSQLKFSVIFISQSVSFFLFSSSTSSLFLSALQFPQCFYILSTITLFFCLPACSFLISFNSPGFLLLCDSGNSFWSQNTPSSSSIFKIEAIDKDTGSGGSITYFLQVKYCLYLHKSSLIYWDFRKQILKRFWGLILLLVPIGPILYCARENKHWQRGCCLTTSSQGWSSRQEEQLELPLTLLCLPAGPLMAGLLLVLPLEWQGEQN